MASPLILLLARTGATLSADSDCRTVSFSTGIMRVLATEIYTNYSVSGQEVYWTNNSLQVHCLYLELPTDFPRPAIQQFHGDLFAFRLEKIWLDRCRQFANHHQVTLYTLYLATIQCIVNEIYTTRRYYCWLSRQPGGPMLISRNRWEYLSTLCRFGISRRSEKTVIGFLKEVQEQVWDTLGDMPIILWKI